MRVHTTCIGLSCATVPTLVSECAVPARRATLLMLFPLMATFGQLLATFIAGGCSYVPVHGWRCTFAATLLPAAALLVVVHRRLSAHKPSMIDKDDDKQAERQTLNSDNVADEGHAVADDDSSTQFTLAYILRHRASRNALIVGCTLHALQQLCGANAVMFVHSTRRGLTHVHVFADNTAQQSLNSPAPTTSTRRAGCRPCRVRPTFSQPCSVYSSSIKSIGGQ
jgi:MFS family permease